MNKKKICIGIISILILVIVASLVRIFLDSKKVKVSNSNIITEDTSTDELLNQGDSTQDGTIENANISDNTVIEDITIKEETTEDKKETVITKKQEETKTSSKTPTTSTAKTITENKSQTQTNIPIQVQTNERTEEKQETTVVQNTNPIVQPTEQTKDEGLKYVRNDTMINQIKQIIKNNETQDMKDFGYNIVVDSSIKNSTNQFTFAESRVINSIRNKFGTIRIYAEDYYNNGQFIMTQCYII